MCFLPFYLSFSESGNWRSEERVPNCEISQRKGIVAGEFFCTIPVNIREKGSTLGPGGALS